MSSRSTQTAVAAGSVLIEINPFVDALADVVVTDIVGNVITTKDMSSFLFPNTFLWLNGDPNQCCVLGFHSFDYELGDASGNLPRFYVMNYSSWISPGLFGDAFTDVTALSHEIARPTTIPLSASTASTI